MGEKKDKLIQIRITSKDKKKIKEIAEKQGKTISEILCNYIREIIEKDDFKSNYSDRLEKRANLFEKKLEKLKDKMNVYK